MIAKDFEDWMTSSGDYADDELDALPANGM